MITTFEVKSYKQLEFLLGAVNAMLMAGLLLVGSRRAQPGGCAIRKNIDELVVWVFSGPFHGIAFPTLRYRRRGIQILVLCSGISWTAGTACPTADAHQLPPDISVRPEAT